MHLGDPAKVKTPRPPSVVRLLAVSAVVALSLLGAAGSVFAHEGDAQPITAGADESCLARYASDAQITVSAADLAQVRAAGFGRFVDDTQTVDISNFNGTTF